MPATVSDRWPALMSRSTAEAYFDGKRRILFAAIALGHLTPLTTGHRDVTFTRAAIDTALLILAASPEQLATVPPEIGSVEAALEWRRVRRK